MSSARFWIVTPSFRSRRWLPCAVASVADQAGGGIEVHHHVQDGGSDDGTREWLEEYAAGQARSPKDGYTFSYESARDGGMYDAVNKGWNLAPPSVDFIGHLNSDEQYLPGVLSSLAALGRKLPSADLFVGGMIVVDAQGRYICQRNSVRPWAWTSRFLCLVYTCSAFYRRGFLFNTGVFFDPSWRIFGDIVFYHQLFRHKVRVALCNRVTSVFVDSGENLALSAGAKSETARFRREYVGRLRPFTKWVNRLTTLRRLRADFFHKFVTGYEIYLPGECASRTGFEIVRPTGRWHRKT